MKGWSKRLSHLLAAQINLDGADRHCVEIHMGGNQERRSHVIAILWAVRGERRSTNISLGWAAAIKKRLEGTAGRIGFAVHVPGNHRYFVSAHGNGSGGGAFKLAGRTERRIEIRIDLVFYIDPHMVDGGQPFSAGGYAQVLRNHVPLYRRANTHTYSGGRW